MVYMHEHHSKDFDPYLKLFLSYTVTQHASV